LSCESNAREIERGIVSGGGEANRSVATQPAGRTRFEVIRTGERDPIPQELRYAIAYRDKYRCRWCGSKGQLQLDHVIPWSNGGPDTDTNLRILCKSCNERRSNFTTDAHDAEVDPLAWDCTLCDDVTDESTSRVFCITCGRVSMAHDHQIRATRRYQWQSEMSWPGWKLSLHTRRQMLRRSSPYLSEEDS
jgi:hypothetical protein